MCMMRMYDRMYDGCCLCMCIYHILIYLQTTQRHCPLLLFVREYIYVINKTCNNVYYISNIAYSLHVIINYNTHSTLSSTTLITLRYQQLHYSLHVIISYTTHSTPSTTTLLTLRYHQLQYSLHASTTLLTLRHQLLHY
jgi:hypothetical protein